jgi:proline dehydrogenase
MSLFRSLVLIGMPLVPKPIVGYVAKPYVAGESVEQAVKRVHELGAEGALATMDVLGESVYSREKAQWFVDQYLALLDVISREKLRASISLKPTMLGLKIDESFCAENIERIVARAKELSTEVTVDMEDHTTTDATLRMYSALLARYDNVGTVLQAYMRRTLSDIEALPAGSRVRLCKGIYIEAREIAWRDYTTVRGNYVAALKKLLKRGIYTEIATHDEYLVWAAMAQLDKMALKPEQYEFQMLLGVDPQLRKLILAAGHRLRVYVPYGVDWYPYCTRRLRENPEMAKSIIKAFFGMR